MPATATQKGYTFRWLTAEAKERARDWWRSCDDGEWWDSVYEDAAQAGLKITSFDLGRSQDIDGCLTMLVRESVSAIIKNHGEGCETREVAERYHEQIAEMEIQNSARVVNGLDEYEIEECLQDVYKKELLRAYFSMLQSECDYVNSDEYIDEMLTYNDYRFTREGERV